jgi:creatinine amidohydrolase
MERAVAILPTKFWAEMRWPDFQRADMSKVVAVLPVAAIEQHGPHLPVGVDAIVNEGYIRRAAARIPDDLPVLFLPLQAIGASSEHLGYPGALMISTETAIRAWRDIGESVARAGCRKLIVINSHGGNVPAIEAMTLDLRVRHRMLAINASWRRLGYPDGLFSAREAAHGIHGGDAETSLTLAFRPETVRMSDARDFSNAGEAMERDFALLRAKPPLGFAWMAGDLNAEGAVGEADRASAAKGEAAVIHGVERFVALLRDAHAFDLSRLAPDPIGVIG